MCLYWCNLISLMKFNLNLEYCRHFPLPIIWEISTTRVKCSELPKAKKTDDFQNSFGELARNTLVFNQSNFKIWTSFVRIVRQNIGRTVNVSVQ